MVAKKAYTTNQILADIAALRGQIAHLQQNAELVNAILTGSLTVDFGATILGEVALNPRIVGLSGNPIIAQTDGSTVTVTQNTATKITKLWSIPANDPIANTTYRLIAWGSGTQGSTAQTLSFNMNAFGVTSQAGSGYASSFAGVNVTFTWNIVGYVQVTATGNGSANVTFIWNSFIKVAGAAVSQPLSGGGTTTAGTTTSAENLNFNAFWGATTGSPTISSLGSTLERIGA